MTVSTRTVSISAVVCAYTMRRWEDILGAVDSLTRQTVAPLEILLVIDHNDDLLRKAGQEFSGQPLVRVVPSTQRAGLSGARNSGIAAARGDVVGFLDDDAAAAPNWIELLAQHFGDPRVFGVGGYADPVWPERRPLWLPTEFDWVVGCSYTGQPTTVAPVRNFIGANMALRRLAFETVGGFSSAVGRIGRIPLGCEETELCIRVRQHHPDVELRYDPSLKVNHRVSADRVRPRYFFRRCYAEGLSKAVVSRLVGTESGLASEKAYVSRVLPAGVLRNAGQAVSGHHGARVMALQRAGAIVVGLATTSIGYVVGRTRAAWGRVGEVEQDCAPIPPRGDAAGDVSAVA